MKVGLRSLGMFFGLGVRPFLGLQIFEINVVLVPFGTVFVFPEKKVRLMSWLFVFDSL